jgi:LysR family transcriptional activator of dmlA
MARFSELEFFIALVRHGSLSAAARVLDITPPAATMRLSAMEKRLGVRLLNRSTRKISLTQEGETYLEHASKLMADLELMDEAVSAAGQRPRGLLRINAPLGFGRTVLAPLVSQFGQTYPAIELQLEVTDRPIDLIDRGFDLAIRFGELPDSAMRARRILSNRRFVCASPAYLHVHGQPHAVGDLAQHRCIVHRQNDEAHGVWKFQHQGQTHSVKVHAAMASNDGDIVLGWALDGQGIAIRSEWDVRKYLDSGRLRQVLSDFELASADLYAYYPHNSHLTLRARLFIDFLVAQLANGVAEGRTTPN